MNVKIRTYGDRAMQELDGYETDKRYAKLIGRFLVHATYILWRVVLLYKRKYLRKVGLYPHRWFFKSFKYLRKHSVKLSMKQWAWFVITQFTLLVASITLRGFGQPIPGRICTILIYIMLFWLWFYKPISKSIKAKFVYIFKGKTKYNSFEETFNKLNKHHEN